MKEIPLSQGMVALVDDEDHEMLIQHKWHYVRRIWEKTGYAVRRTKRAQNGKQGVIFMHRVILNTPCGYETDHINGDGLDNQKGNLRVATQSQNSWNSGKQQNNTSGYKGVCWNKKAQKWEVHIGFNSKNVYLGRFKSKDEAAKIYNAAAVRLHGEFAVLNQIVERAVRKAVQSRTKRKVVGEV